MEKQIYIRLLLLIIVLGLALRLYNLDTESLWTDEAFSVRHAGQETISEVIDAVKETEAAPPGYYVFLHSWIGWFGNSADSVRFPSVIFGTLVILLLFLLARTLYDAGTALLASLFISTSMLQVLYSQEARIYSLFTALTLLAAYFLVEIIQHEKVGRKCRAWYWFYAIACLASIYTNYLGIIFVLVPFFIFLIFWKEKKLAQTLFWKLSAASLTVLILSWPLFSVVRSQYTLLHFGLADILLARGLPSFLAQLGLWFFLLPLLTILIFMALFFLVRMTEKKIPLSWKSTLWEKSTKRKLLIIFLVVWGLLYAFLIVHPLTIFGLTIMQVPLTHSYFLIRHSLFVAPLFYIYFARKITTLFSKRMITFCIIFILCINIFSLHWYYAHPTKAEWKEAGEFISSYSGSQDGSQGVPLVLLDSGGMANHFLLDYYSQKKFRIVPLTWANRAKVGRALEQLNSSQVSEIVQGQEEVWLVLSRNPETDDKYKEMLGTSLTNDLYQEFYQIKIYHYKARDTAPALGVDLYKSGIMNIRGAYG